MLASLPAATYTIEVFDTTVFATETWTRVATVAVSGRSTAFPPSERTAHPWYVLQASVDAGPLHDSAEKDKAKAQKNTDRRVRVVLDQLSQALVRTGLLRPNLSEEAVRDLVELTQARGVAVVPDTNAMVSGSTHWLLRSLVRPSVWLFPVTISLTTVQQRDANLKSLLNSPSLTNLIPALRSRSVVSAALGLLERWRGRYQILEVDPQLLRYVRPSGKGTADADDTDILEDRLMIEAIHAVLPAMRSSIERRVLTSDVLLARVLHAEAIPTLFLQTPILAQGTDIPCVRYEPIAGRFMGAPLLAILWDLAHTFARVRLLSAAGDVHLDLQLYWPGKRAEDWRHEILQAVTLQLQQPAPSATVPTKGGSSAFGSALPDIAVPQWLRFAGVVLAGSGAVDIVITRMASNPPSGEVARKAAAMLLRTGLATADTAGTLLTTDRAQALNAALEAEDLDGASEVLRTWASYDALLSHLADAGEMRFDDHAAMADAVGLPKASKKAVERLARLPVYLAQAWSDGNALRDGGNRPSDTDLAALFAQTFDENQVDGLAPVAKLVPAMSRAARISPYALARQLDAMIRRGMFPEHSFLPAAGSLPNSRDQVVTGPLINLRLKPVPTDRLLVGGQPVFTVGRRST